MRVTIEEAIDLIDPRIVQRTFLTLRPTPNPVPIDILEDALRVFLEKVVSRRPPAPGKLHGCMEDALLSHGTWTRSNVSTTRLADGPRGKCFETCYELSQSLAGYSYVEGYALMDGAAEPFHHAWLVGPHGIEDPTWRQLWQQKVRRQPERVWTGDCVYLGVQIEPNRHLRWRESTGYPNLLSVYDDDIERVLAGRMPWL